MLLELTQTDRRFRGPAYRYVRKTDDLPDYEAIAEDPICKVKLFLPGSRLTHYIFAADRYGEVDVVTNYCVSALGPDCDEEGDIFTGDLLEVRNAHGLPLERDLSFEPTPLSEVRQLEVPA